MALPEEIRYQLLKELEQNPNISQRELARNMGVSLGKVNYCIKNVIEAGLVKVRNFAQSNNKLGYTYVLTPHGLKEKAKVTLSFLKYKQQQYDILKSEIERLQIEVDNMSAQDGVEKKFK